MQNNGACSFIDINKLTVELEVTMKKTLKVAVIFALSFMFVVLGISISFTSFGRANAETTGSTSEGISTTDPTEPTTPIVIVPVIPVTTEPTVPTNPIESSPTQGEAGDIKWVLNDEKQLIISKNNTEEVCSTGNWSETYIEYKTVYTIDGGSFEIPVEKERRLDTPWSKCDYNSVIIEDGVTEIGACSFYSAEFEKISLPDSLMAIDKAAFRGAKTSAEFVFPPNLTDIGDAAFMYSGFNFGDSVLPESLSALGVYAFSGCSELESVDLSQSSVKDIKEYAFYNCKNLKSVTFPNQLESIGTSAFSNTNIKEYIILSKNVKIGYKPMGYYSQIGEPKITETKFIGYTGSTVAKYAAGSDDFTFEALDDGKGDLNFDGLIDKHDVQLLQQYLTGKYEFNNNAVERADFLEDSSINVLDVMKMKRVVLEK